MLKKIQKLHQTFCLRKKGGGLSRSGNEILIVVVIGAAILLILNAAMPPVPQNLIDKVSTSLTRRGRTAVRASEKQRARPAKTGRFLLPNRERRFIA
jgi:hypothetical protein